MERYICIHGHFYQPPRENPWLEEVELQDPAYPYHDWNERITAECYAPNTTSRILDQDGRIIDIVNDYSKISFDFGPTLLYWMERHQPEVYEAILRADKISIERFSGHGSAIAQVYNHIIMPLANRRDKHTQVIWGIKDFQKRFGRFPEGMWLPETAVDIETLEVLAELGIKFTILAPNQAKSIKKLHDKDIVCDVSGGKIDPTMPYLFNLPSGRTITLFFYDGPISHDIAFGELLISGEAFANRLISAFADNRDWPQIVHIATDGETYGHHQRYGDMALAFCLYYIENRNLARITNYGEYLEKHPPTYEVEIFENSSWSCIHGIERWRDNCGCNSGMKPGWTQSWRKPLRDTFDWLSERLSFIYESIAREYLKNPWEARDRYIEVILDRSKETVERFIQEHAIKQLNDEEKVLILKLLEIQRHAMLMYTSCGWFFDELSGPETVQTMQYAGRAIQLSEGIVSENLEYAFKRRLTLAKSNIPEHEHGAVIYDRFVKTAMIDTKKVGVHYAVSSLFEDYIDETTIYSYVVKKDDYQRIPAGNTKIAVGRVTVSSSITRESEQISFCVLHFGGHALNGGVRTFLGHDAYQSMKEEIITTFERGAFADIVRLMDNHFGMHNYSLPNLFRDQQRTILNLLISKIVEDFENAYRQMYEGNRILMGFLKEIGMPVKKAFCTVAEFILNTDMKKAFLEEILDVSRIQNLLDEMKLLDVPLDAVDIEFVARRRLESLMQNLSMNPSDIMILFEIQKRLELYKLLPIEINYWQAQNTYYKIAKTIYREVLTKAKSEEDARKWLAPFKYIGEMLFFDIASLLPEV